MRSTPSAPTPEARVGRWTLRGAGNAIQPLKRRASARKARAGARETAILVCAAGVRESAKKLEHGDHELWIAHLRRTLARQRLANLDTSRDPCART